jgi:hypothetical protein
MDHELYARQPSYAQLQRAVRVMTVFLEHGGGDELQDEILAIEDEDDGISLLLLGLVQLCQNALYTLADGAGLTQQQALERFAMIRAAHGEGILNLPPGDGHQP